MTSQETERRIPVWEALSDLFLDTELDLVTYKYIARIVAESGYSAFEIKSILWNEVFPVLESNLRSVAGVWDGYPRDWLEKHLAIDAYAVPNISSNAVGTEIISCWANVAAHLPSQYA